MNKDVEQYRPAFEAWAEKNGISTVRAIDGYLTALTENLWCVWIAAKLDSESN